tara:strand:- start:2598 stop:3287 length:690 start_codon:yes stop_codon:yes gene_type:complete
MRNFRGFQNFIGTGAYEPTKTNLFEVHIDTPRFVFAGPDNTLSPSGSIELREWSDAVDYLADEVVIPSRALMTGDVQNFGIQRKFATQQQPQEMNIQFLVPRNQWTRYVFDRWIQIISRDSDNRTMFYDDYVADIQITKYESGSNEILRAIDNNGKIVGKTRLNKPTAVWTAFNCFPVNVSTMKFNNGPQQLMKLDVQFRIERLRMEALLRTTGDWTVDTFTDEKVVLG